MGNDITAKIASLAVGASLLCAGCSSSAVKGHPVTSPVVPVKDLDHVAVEQFIETQLDVTDVLCNHGANFPMYENGAKFKCTAAGGHTFTVTIKNKVTGDYVVK